MKRDVSVRVKKSRRFFFSSGMFLQDLTFIHLGNPGSVNNDKSSVNFNKRWRQFTVLEKIRKCQQS